MSRPAKETVGPGVEAVAHHRLRRRFAGRRVQRDIRSGPLLDARASPYFCGR